MIELCIFLKLSFNKIILQYYWSLEFTIFCRHNIWCSSPKFWCSSCACFFCGVVSELLYLIWFYGVFFCGKLLRSCTCWATSEVLVLQIVINGKGLLIGFGLGFLIETGGCDKPLSPWDASAGHQPCVWHPPPPTLQDSISAALELHHCFLGSSLEFSEIPLLVGFASLLCLISKIWCSSPSQLWGDLENPNILVRTSNTPLLPKSGRVKRCPQAPKPWALTCLAPLILNTPKNPNRMSFCHLTWKAWAAPRCHRRGTIWDTAGGSCWMALCVLCPFAG